MLEDSVHIVGIADQTQKRHHVKAYVPYRPYNGRKGITNGRH